MIKRIRLPLGPRSYDICIGNGVLQRSEKLIKAVTNVKSFVILSSPFIFKKHGKHLYKSLEKRNIKIETILVPDGEAQKNERGLLKVLEKMARLGLQRDACLIALGGGVIGDLGGLAASLYMRGIDFIQCPTTLLAQVDASVGGKTAVDFFGIKNLIGSFYQPKLVLIDPNVLKTLEERQFKTGLAEVVKYGVIQDKNLFKVLETHLPSILNKDPELLSFLIARSCSIKSKVVSEDEKEAGKRAWLNYGHTLGHALESYFQYKVLTHGEAIAYGMWFSSLLSRSIKLCADSVVDRQYHLLKRIGLFRRLPSFNPTKIYQKMFLDKKARGGKILFVLTRKIGLVTIRKNVPKSIIFSALNQLRAEANKPQ